MKIRKIYDELWKEITSTLLVGAVALGLAEFNARHIESRAYAERDQESKLEQSVSNPCISDVTFTIIKEIPYLIETPMQTISETIVKDRSLSLNRLTTEKIKVVDYMNKTPVPTYTPTFTQKPTKTSYDLNLGNFLDGSDTIIKDVTIPLNQLEMFLNSDQEIRSTPIPFPTKDTRIDFNDLKILSDIIYGEGAICSREEKIAIGYTVVNRLNFGYEISLKKISKAYDCMKDGRLKIGFEKNKREDMKTYEECNEIAEGVLTERILDPFLEYGGATHFVNLKKSNPSWAYDKDVVSLGKVYDSGKYGEHNFYREERG